MKYREYPFEIPFTQYLLPDGRMREVQWECESQEQEDMAKVMLEEGCKFECEVLNNGYVSLSVEKGDEQLGIEVCPNGPDVPKKVEALIKRVYESHIKLK